MLCYTVTLKYRYQSFDAMRFMSTIMRTAYVYANVPIYVLNCFLTHTLAEEITHIIYRVKHEFFFFKYGSIHTYMVCRRLWTLNHTFIYIWMAEKAKSIKNYLPWHIYIFSYKKTKLHKPQIKKSKLEANLEITVFVFN